MSRNRSSSSRRGARIVVDMVDSVPYGFALPRPAAIGQCGCLDAYLICATPRTGSSLLCGLLASTGVAGNPESYFRQQDEPSWAAQWGISGTDGTFDYALYLQTALAAGRSENGVFGARVMWGTLDEIIDKLGTLYPTSLGGTSIS